MDSSKLIKAREYYDLTSNGTPKSEASLAVMGKKSPKQIEESEEYMAVVSAASIVEKERLKKDIENVKRKQIQAYSNLLDKGEALMAEAKTIEEKVIAQSNQRNNLTTGVIESAIAWDGEDRNQNDLGAVLEGVFV